MHQEVSQREPGLCPRCGMALVPAGARFAMLHHLLGMPAHMLRRPWMLVAMVAAMAAMAVFMVR